VITFLAGDTAFYTDPVPLEVAEILNEKLQGIISPADLDDLLDDMKGA
jgi:hypothetical protein